MGEGALLRYYILEYAASEQEQRKESVPQLAKH